MYVDFVFFCSCSFVVDPSFVIIGYTGAAFSLLLYQAHIKPIDWLMRVPHEICKSNLSASVNKFLQLCTEENMHGLSFKMAVEVCAVR